MSGRNSAQQALLLSTALSAALMMSASSSAYGATVTVPAPVAPATSVDGGAVNAAIVTAISAPASSALTLTAPSNTVVSGASIALIPSTGQGDGKVVFTNDGKIGAVDSSDAVTSDVAVNLNGRPAAGAANTFTGTNNGLISGGLNVGSGSAFGGAVTITNAGHIHNGIAATGQGDVSVTTSSAGVVHSGNVSAVSQAASKDTVAGNFTTTNITGGKASIAQAGDAANIDDSARGDLTASGLDGADVTVSAKAGKIVANAGGVIQTVSGGDPTAAGATKTTSRNDVTRGGGVATVAISTGGDVNNVSAAGVGGAKVTVDGAVANNVAVSSLAVTGTNATTVTQNSAGITTATDSKSASVGAGKDAAVAINSGATVGGNVTANADGVATVTADGAVDGNIVAKSENVNTDYENSQTFDATTLATTSNATTTRKVAAGKQAAVNVGKAGVIGGDVTVSGHSGASTTVGGTVDGNVSLTSSAINRVDDQDIVLNTRKVSETAAGGVAAATVDADGTIKGNLSANGDAGIVLSNAGTIDGNVSGISARSLNGEDHSSTSKTTTSPTLNETVVTTSDVGTSTHVVGTASFSNAAKALVEGGVSLNAVGDITVDNSGAIFGQTVAVSHAVDTARSSEYTSKSSTAIATPPALDVTTFTESTKTQDSSNAVGGNVTGTYGGSNGTINFVSADGSITQTADKASTANVSGSLFGSLNSTAGSSNYSDQSELLTTIVVDSAGTGTGTASYTGSNQTVTNSGGDSTVTIAGAVRQGLASDTPNVYSTATGNSVVAVNGGTVEGSISSTAAASNTTNDGSVSVALTVTAGVVRTDTLTQSATSTGNAAGGAASVDLSGTAKAATLGGDVAAYGQTGATVSVASGATVGNSAGGAIGNVVARADGTDYINTYDSSFVRDAANGTATATEKSDYVSGTSANVGNASVAVAGTVTGDAEASASRGNATTSVTGTVGGNARAYAVGGSSSDTYLGEYAGKVGDSDATSFGGLTLPSLVKTTVTSNYTPLGGTAAVVVDSAPVIQNLGLTGVAGDIYAAGLGGAGVTITAGSKVGGDATADSSDFSAFTSSTVDTYGATHDQTSVQANTLAGAAATVDIGIGSEVGGDAAAYGDTAANVSNAGTIVGSVTARSLGVNSTNTLKSTNLDVVALRQTDETVVNTGVGGTASVTNAPGALIYENVNVAAGNGSLTNNGAIGGNITLGSSVDNYTTNEVRTATSTTQTVTPPTEKTAQTYVLDQNNFLKGGISVVGATSNDPFLGSTVQVMTSDVKATINLNNGSATLGNIYAQQDETGVRVTNTTLNLNGAGFLGADVFKQSSLTLDEVAPELLLSQDAQTVAPDLYDPEMGEPINQSVTIRGVDSVNKAGPGTFVVNFAPYSPASAPGLQPGWSADVGSINVTGGELQVTGPAYDPMASDAPYIGIKGDINNSATLVLGRRTLISPASLGDSISSAGKEYISGVRIAQTGNYTQTDTGTTVAGISPSLVRSSPVTIGAGSTTGTEVLGPVGAAAQANYFTTPNYGGSIQSTASRVDITGKLTLAGKVSVDITRDAIYSAGDGYTLFTYTDPASSVTATVDQSISSPFVSFELKNDATAGTVTIAAKRVGYATAATNPNAVSAANALDALIPTLVTSIKNDAAGEASFSTVKDIGLVQDAANIVSGLDWRLNTTQAAEVFNELSSAEFYGSLAAIQQNSVLTDSFNTALAINNNKAGVSVWINPVGRFTRYGGTKSGASQIKDNTYGGAFGVQLGYAEDGSIGIGVAYANHDINARRTPEEASAHTYSVGVNWAQGFGRLHANGQFVYGFSNFDVSRTLAILDRTPTASFKGREWDGSIQLGYDVVVNHSFALTPYGKLALRHWSLGGFSEENGAGIGVTSGKDSKTVFVPEVGLRLATTFQASDNVMVRPFGKISYTFQGDVGSAREFSYAAGGATFRLKGVDPKGFGSADIGINALFNQRIGVFVVTGIDFGGSHKGAQARGGINVNF